MANQRLSGFEIHKKIRAFRKARKYTEHMRAYRRAHPICEHCGYRLTEQVHHRIGMWEIVSSGRLSLVYDHANLQGVCRPCHKAIHQDGQQIENLIAVVGPPAGGKSTYVKEHTKPADLVFDWDEVLWEMAGHRSRLSCERDEYQGKVLVMRDQFVHHVRDTPGKVGWLVITSPVKAQHYTNELIWCVPPMHVIQRRLLERYETGEYDATEYARVKATVKRWFSRHQCPPPSTPKQGGDDGPQGASPRISGATRKANPWTL